MRNLIISAMLAGAALVAASPAAAQPGYGQDWGRGGYGQDYGRGGYGQYGGWNQTQFNREFARIDQQIERGVRSRQISRREADRLRAELRHLRSLHRSYFRDGRLDSRERRDLEVRLDRLQRQVRFERRDWDDRRR